MKKILLSYLLILMVSCATKDEPQKFEEDNVAYVITLDSMGKTGSTYYPVDGKIQVDNIMEEITFKDKDGTNKKVKPSYSIIYN